MFGYGGPLTMCGLDVTHTLQATPERIDRVRAVTGRLASVLADLLTFFSEMYVSRHHHISGAAVHDPCAVMALTHPQLFTSVQRHVQVETEGALTRGMTVIDQRDLRSVPPPTCRVMTSVDPEAAFAVIVEAILSFVNLSISTDDPTWGGLIAEGRTSVHQAWWVLVFPLITLFLTVLSFSQLGEGLKDRFDPVLR